MDTTSGTVKQGIASPAAVSGRRRRPWIETHWRRLVVLILVANVYYTLQRISNRRSIFEPRHETSGAENLAPAGGQFDWADTPPSKQLDYQPCYSEDGAGFECARLSVPLDYFNQTSDAEISIAVVRYPASVPLTDSRYGGAILFNPGGPGGSGVNFLRGSYSTLAETIHHGNNEDAGKVYDLISFDPRGVGLSTPNLDCFPSFLQGWTWDLRRMEEGILGSSDATFGRLWSMAKAFSGSCALPALSDPTHFRKYVSTASVATDMLQIVERHGEWREAEVRRLLSVDSPRKGHAVNVPENIRYKPGKEQINYWGFSYGTYLGMTFASLYPDRISRLIIDGVVDAVDYTATLWTDNLVDTEKEMRSFYKYCANVGYPNCSLANETGKTTASGVEGRVADILKSLIHNPLPIIGDIPEIITYSDVRHLIFSGLYSPLQSFPLIADALVEIENGKGTILAGLLRPYHEASCPSETKTTDMKPFALQRSALDADAVTAIACTDGDPQAFLSRDNFRKYWHNLTELSPTIGPLWATLRLHCVNYNVRPAYRYSGPWSGNTSFPILLIGNSADPVTPVRHARKMAEGFKAARVLEQESSGHCSVSAPSKCTRNVVYRYFQHGELPEEGARCKVDELPFSSRPTVTEQFADQLSARLMGRMNGNLMPVFH